MWKYFIVILLLLKANTPLAQGIDSENEKKHYIQITTNIGKINIFLYNKTPKHRDNFLKLIDRDYYNDILFHRVIKGFVIQAGDPESKEQKKFVQYGEGGANYTIDAEIVKGLHHTQGALAMAREGDDTNPLRASSGSHFYIVQGKEVTDEEIAKTENELGYKIDAQTVNDYKSTGGTPHLDGKYTVFGRVTEGMDIVDKICEMQTDANDRPYYDVVIEEVKLVKIR